MNGSIRFGITLWLAVLVSAAPLLSQTADRESAGERLDRLERRFESLNHSLDMLQKNIDDVLWYHRVGDVAMIDKVRHYGPPPARIPNPKAMGAGNPVKFYSYVFIPRTADRTKKYPLIVLPHRDDRIGTRHQRQLCGLQNRHGAGCPTRDSRRHRRDAAGRRPVGRARRR